MSVTVTYSGGRSVDLDSIEEVLEDSDVVPLELPANAGVDVPFPEAALETLHDSEALILRLGRVDDTVLRHAPDLEVISIFGSGFDHVDVTAARDEGVAVTHNPEVPAKSVVEHTCALLLSLLRDLPSTTAATADADWDGPRARFEQSAESLHAQRVGVVGLGTIGFDVGNALSAFGADVYGYDPYVTRSYDSPYWPRYDAETIDDAGIEMVDDVTTLFETSDIVTLHVPSTDETERMVGKEQLAALGDGYLINTARGDVVDADALTEVVRNREIAGAALDVFEREPPRVDDVLLSAPNTIVTPHVGGFGAADVKTGSRTCAKKVSAILAGESIEGLLTPAATE